MAVIPIHALNADWLTQQIALLTPSPTVEIGPQHFAQFAYPPTPPLALIYDRRQDHGISEAGLQAMARLPNLVAVGIWAEDPIGLRIAYHQQQLLLGQGLREVMVGDRLRELLMWAERMLKQRRLPPLHQNRESG